MSTRLFAGLVLATASASVAQVDSILDLPPFAPYSLQSLPQNLVGMSIEEDRWPDWTGNYTSPNSFTMQLLQNLKDRTGVAIPVRVGGDSEDNSFYVPSVGIEEDIHFPMVSNASNKLFPEATKFTIGEEFYKLSGLFPAGTAFTWGINAKNSSVDEVYKQAGALFNAFDDPSLSHVSLSLIEIGNEVDFYSRDPYTWAAVWHRYGTNISTSFKMVDRSTKFQIGALGGAWTVDNLLQTHIANTDLQDFVSTFSSHHYNNGPYSPTVPDLTRKAQVRANLSQFAIGVASCKQVGVDFVLGETNTFSGHGFGGVSDSAAAAIWGVDYILQAASFGTKALFFHNGIGYKYNLFQPIDGLGNNITAFNASATRHILPLYHALSVVGDAAGTSGNSFVAELYTDTADLAAYVIYEGGDLSRIVLINSLPFLSTNATERPSIRVNISALAETGGMKVKRLYTPFLDSLQGLTWGGQSYDGQDGKAAGDLVLEDVVGGIVQLTASSAALLYVNGTTS